MSTYYQRLKTDNPGKYPENIGKSWCEDEETKLIESCKLGVPIDDIANTHMRTKGGIRARLGVIVSRCHFDYKWNVDRINRYTGLDKDYISKIIKKADDKFVVKVKIFANIGTQTEESSIDKLKKD